MYGLKACLKSMKQDLFKKYDHCLKLGLDDQ